MERPNTTVLDHSLEEELRAPPSDRLGRLRAIDRGRVRSALFDGPRAPETLGRFRILGLLGRGGMGTVLEAHDDTLDRRVAIKQLHEGSSPLHRQRLLREAQALARLSHLNVVQVYDAGEQDGRLFIAMERIDGRTKVQRTIPRHVTFSLGKGYLVHAIGSVP